ncbi:MAG: hypothetical protein CR986_05085 [Ignavibacteriae bacterium]|nr:MAG: hypothetical protein CR986_05085 [Ignavibacteriota bacterium]
MNHLNHLLENKKVFFNFMNENYTIFQNSNLFFRDIQYAVISYFEMKEKPIKYAQAEVVTTNFIDKLVKTNELTEINKRTYKINFELGLTKNTIEI